MEDKIVFSKEEDEILSALVDNIKVVYDNTSYHLKTGSFRSTIWNNIAEEVGRPSDECKKRWRIIRKPYLLKKRLLVPKKKKEPPSSELSYLDDDYLVYDDALLEFINTI